MAAQETPTTPLLNEKGRAEDLFHFTPSCAVRSLNREHVSFL